MLFPGRLDPVSCFSHVIGRLLQWILVVGRLEPVDGGMQQVWLSLSSSLEHANLRVAGLPDAVDKQHPFPSQKFGLWKDQNFRKCRRVGLAGLETVGMS